MEYHNAPLIAIKLSWIHRI